MSAERKALVFALIAVLLWSTVATAFKLALVGLSPRWLVAIASLVSLLFLSGYVLLTSQLDCALSALKKSKWFYLRQGLSNPLIYYLILFQAYDLLSAQQAQAINYTWALTMSLLAVPLLGHSLYRRDIVALSLAYLGVVVIATRGNVFSLEFSSLSGVMLALLSTIVWALYWIWNIDREERPEISLWCGFLIATPVAFLIAVAWDGWPINVGQSVWAAMYVGLFEMGVTFLLWQKALTLTSRAASISSLIFLSPFLSLVFINQILGEDIHSATFIGLTLIVSGLVVQKIKVQSTKKPA
jgi:drug/metabolite transporter (DMT)-like permease